MFRARTGEVTSWRAAYGYRRIACSPATGPAHLEIYEPEADVVRRIFAERLAAVSLRYVRGEPAVPATREADVRPFIGGDYLAGTIGTSASYCTAGIPVEQAQWPYEDYLLTARHCFGLNTKVTTENSSTSVGTVVVYNQYTDSELIDTHYAKGAGSNGDEGEYDTSSGGIKYYPLKGTQYPVAGELVCQDGVYSYDEGHGVPCRIAVQAPVTYSLCINNSTDCYTVSGWWGKSTTGNPVVVHGDSGSVVFCYCSGNRKAIGLTSALSDKSSWGYLHIYFTAFSNIQVDMGNLGYDFYLNPHNSPSK